ncbi:hypothetical protein K8R42_02520 [bacterium]|nr:hypothetical protein [bacterium]
MIKNDFGFIFWAHLLVILAYIVSPFYLGWHWVVLIVIIFILQDKVFKKCLLTSAQLEGREDVSKDELSFYVYYFKKMGLSINVSWVKKYFAYILLWLVFIFSILWQIILSKSPLWFGNLF